MGKPTRLTQAKRQREIAQRERKQEKHDQRALKKQDSSERDEKRAQGIDPDLEGIVPGPQPPLDE